MVSDLYAPQETPASLNSMYRAKKLLLGDWRLPRTIAAKELRQEALPTPASTRVDFTDSWL